jgi:hypothetical protein
VVFRWPLTAILVISGCSVATPPSGETLPVVQGLLIVGEQRHLLTVTWSVPGDSSFAFQGPAKPIAPSQVQLEVLLPGGTLVPAVSTDPARGHFEVTADILPNTAYSLQGTVAGRAVTASLTTPGPFMIAQPADDTVRLSDTGNQLRQVTYRWNASGAEGYTVKPFLAGIVPASDTTGTIFFSSLADTANVTLLALERHAAGFLLPDFFDRRRGNVTGALGVLGAASTAKRVFIWQ